MKAVIIIKKDLKNKYKPLPDKLRRYSVKNNLEIIKEFEIDFDSDKSGIVDFINKHEEKLTIITHSDIVIWNQSCANIFIRTHNSFFHIIECKTGKVLENLDRDRFKPNPQEILFLEMSYKRFSDIFNYVMLDNFWEDSSEQRFHIVKDAFAIYSECLNYDPIKVIIDRIKTNRPPMEGEIAGELFKIIRNILMHFPFFTKWEEVYISKNLINWHKPSQTIDKFFEKYCGKDVIKYRYWEEDKKRMTYLDIKFPSQYEGNIKFYLKDILTEKEGIPFCLILMKKVLNAGAVYE